LAAVSKHYPQGPGTRPTEGFDTADLLEAKALLAELAG